MLSIMVVLAIVLCFLFVGEVQGQASPFRFFGYIGEDFFEDNHDIEASGVAIAPDGSHLVVVSDDGEIAFLNLNDYNSGHCMVESIEDVDGDDFEGVAIDPATWTTDDMHAYVVHEGGDDDEPFLYKIEYEFDPEAGTCGARLVDSRSLRGAIPCLETSNGIESLGLKSESSGVDPAVFFVGIQDTGKVYEVTSEGSSNGSEYCYDGGLGADDISATTYSGEHGHLWSYIESQNRIAVVDVTKDCLVAAYQKTDFSEDEEGLAIDFENGLVYLVVDGQGDSSVVSVYNFTYPEDLGECLDNGVRPASCSGFTVCEDTPSYSSTSFHSRSRRMSH